MNGQIVLCKGINDGDELEYSLEKLSEYAACVAERFSRAGRTYQIPRRTCIHWNLLTKRMRQVPDQSGRVVAEDYDEEAWHSFYPRFG